MFPEYLCAITLKHREKLYQIVLGLAHDLLLNKSSRKKFPTANQSTSACQERQFIKFIKIVALHYILYDRTYF